MVSSIWHKELKEADTSKQLLKESKILNQMSKVEGFPKFLWYGEEGDYNVMVT